MQRIPFCSPSITAQDIRLVAESVPHCGGASAQDFQHRFERTFSDCLSIQHAFAVSSRTAALHLALAALKIGPGDEVILPEIAPATALLPLRYLGATAAFADVHPRTLCLSADAFRQSITPRTKAVVAYHVYGNIAEMHRVRAIARARGVVVIEDASDALGSRFHGRHAGRLGDVAVFGFGRTETITSGDGGMIVTDSDRFASALKECLQETSVDYPISPMQAALGTSQLNRLPELIAQRQQVARWYREALSGVEGISTPTCALDADCVPAETVVMLEPSLGWTAAELIEEMAAYEIETRPICKPLSSLSVHQESLQAKVAMARNRVAYVLSSLGIVMPSGTSLTKDQVDRAATCLKSLVKKRQPVPATYRQAA